MKKLLLICILGSLNIFGQQITVSTSQNVKKEFSADTAFINFTLNTEGDNLDKVRFKNRETVNEFLSTLKQKGIKIDSVKTENIYDRKFLKLKEEKDKGYETVMTFSILSNENEGSKIIDELEKIGAIGYKMQKGKITFKLVANSKDKKETFKIIAEKVKRLRDEFGRDFEFNFYDTYKKKDRIDEEYFEIVNDFSFKLRNVEKINELIEIAGKYNIEIDRDIEYSLSNLKEKYLDMYEEAYTKARKKANDLIDNSYKINKVKNIKENKYIVDELERKINVADNVVEYAVPKMYAAKMVQESFVNSSSDVAIEINIPKVVIQNELKIDFIADDGKENKKYENEMTLYSSFNKDIKADIVQLELSINTKSNKDMMDSNNQNAKVFSKFKELLQYSGIKYEKIETISFDTNRYESFENRLGKVIKDEQEAVFKVKVSDVSTVNFERFIELTDSEDVKIYKNNDVIYLDIKGSSKTVKDAYNNANLKYSELKNELSKSNIDLILEEYINNERIEREEISEKKVNYVTNNKIKITTKDVTNLSMLISIIKEFGVEIDSIDYGLDNIEKLNTVFYKELLQDINNKMKKFDKLENIETRGYKAIKDSENQLYSYYYKESLRLNRNNYNYKMDVSNSEIINKAKENPYKIFVKPYNANMSIEAIINLK
ncbi:SIMPL domain-containing protein [Streptobacillus felis]|uniref:SIMPL domain-containing protein n=1 Tax=Streptobacillus felis TaxID=1384509 RepID=A0A7Z0PFQ6_9FUSO|nr:SIMPL domain-containing protein [Streptobacillus felis]NYV27722.1 SIMPL domain-containing protein [Streptobacillus felis]